MEVYLSARNQRLNEVVKVLTVWGYPFVLGLVASTAGGLILYFRRRGWW